MLNDASVEGFITSTWLPSDLSAHGLIKSLPEVTRSMLNHGSLMVNKWLLDDLLIKLLFDG